MRRLGSSRLRAGPVAVFCGLGNPAAFENTLRSLDAHLVACRTFPDHHAYTRDDVADLQAWVAGLGHPGLQVVTTQKDLVKLRLTALGAVPLWALRIHLRVLHGQDALHRILDGVGNSATTGRGELVEP